MQIVRVEQKSPEWWDLKVAKVSGTRFGQVISTRKNALIYSLLGEKLQGFIEVEDYINDDMQYGIDNEPVAIDKYEQQENVKTESVGAILSDFSTIHMASPDAIIEMAGIAVEVKSTQSIAKHTQRFFEGIETAHLPQCINYFAVSDDVKEVHFVSYCGFDDVRPIHVIKLTRNTVIDAKKGTTIQDQVVRGRKLIADVEVKLNQMFETYKF